MQAGRLTGRQACRQAGKQASISLFLLVDLHVN
jgi:hypothetical protein